VSEIWEISHEAGDFRVLFLPRAENFSEDASAGLARYAAGLPAGRQVIAMVYPDRRGAGFALSRFNDDLRMDFTRISAEGDVHFAHARGFVAKSSATDLGRIRDLLNMSRVSV
jgi:hypothetical protein